MRRVLSLAAPVVLAVLYVRFLSRVYARRKRNERRVWAGAGAE